MPLVELDLSTDNTDVPGDVGSFLREAERRIERFQRAGRLPAFVPSDYSSAYRALRYLAESGAAPGNVFCEWGSGFGVVACLAAMLDFDACGIEIEGELVDAARELADDFGLPASFVRGSFIPEGSLARPDPVDGFSWLSTDERGGYDELGLGPDVLDVVFAYPWPDEETFTGEVFGQFAAPGALLLTYHGGETFRLRRKVRRRGRGGGSG